MLSTGTTAITTSGAGAVTVNPDTQTGWSDVRYLFAVNNGSTDAFFRLNGHSWIVLLAKSSVNVGFDRHFTGTIEVERRSADVSEIFFVAFQSTETP